MAILDENNQSRRHTAAEQQITPNFRCFSLLPQFRLIILLFYLIIAILFYYTAILL